MEVKDLRKNLQSKIEAINNMPKNETNIYKIGKAAGMKEGFEYVLDITEPIKIPKAVVIGCIIAAIVGIGLWFYLDSIINSFLNK